MALTSKFKAEFQNQAVNIGRFNIAIFGKTGVGKSTLINAVFGRDIATTGIGRPVTVGSDLYINENGTLGILDTRGLEIGSDDDKIIKELRRFILEGRKEGNGTQIHAVWYCIRGLDRRFEATESQFIRELAALDIPVILVLTQVPLKDGLVHPDVVELAKHIESLNLPIVDGKPILINAKRDSFTGQPEHGLMELVDLTFRISPQALQTAFAAAQQLSLKQKTEVSQRYIAAATTAAAAAAAAPIPFGDATVLVPIQLGMMAQIAHIYNLHMDKATLLAIASTGIATKAGQTLAGNLLKFIPGAGSIAGGVINASVASSITLAMGHAWLSVCQRESGGEIPRINGSIDTDAVKQIFKDEFRKRFSWFLPKKKK